MRTTRRPNLVLVLSDSMRARNVSCYGYERQTTPNIDRRAQRGGQFMNAFVQAPFTVSSTTSMLTSVYPSAHRQERYGQELDPGLVSLQELLREAGYHTAAFVSNPHVNEASGMVSGFDTFTDGRPWYKRSRLTSRFTAWAENGRAINRAVQQHLSRLESRPFYFLVLYNDSHVPFSSLPRVLLPLVGKKYHTPDFGTYTYTDAELERIKGMYDQAIQRADGFIGALWDMFAGAGLANNTAFLISTDHGEGLDRRPDRGGHGRLYENGIHVPLIALAPHVEEPGRTVDDLVAAVDFAPTLLDLAGLTSPPQFQGQSLVPYLSGGEAPAPRDYVISEYHDSACIRTRRWKLIQRGLGISQPLADVEGAVELYDLVNDVDESVNLAEVHPDLVADLKRTLVETLRSSKEVSQQPQQFEQRDVVARRLRGLGYMN